MQHYCAIHPQVVDSFKKLLNGRSDDEFMFKQLSFERWLKQHTTVVSFSSLYSCKAP